MKKIFNFTVFIFYFMLISTNLTNANSFSNNLCWLINTQPQYIDYFSEGLAVISNEDGKYGYVDLNGNIKIPHSYFKAEKFTDGVALVYNEQKKCGFIDKNNNVVIPFIYDSGDSFNNNIAIMKLEDKYGIINKQGDKITEFVYEQIYANPFNKSLSDIIAAKKNGKWGYLNVKNGEEVIPFVFDEVSEFYNDYASVKINAKYGAINKEGELIIPYNYDTMSLCNNSIFIVSKDGKFGAIDANNQTVIPFYYIYMQYISSDIITCVEPNKYLWGAYNLEGKTKIPFEYDELNMFDQNNIKATKNGKKGVIDKNNGIVIPLEYEDLNGYLVEGVIQVIKNNKCGYIDLNNNVITDYIYDYPFSSQFYDNTAIVVKDGKYGILNSEGKLLTEICYQYIERFVDQYKIIDENNNIGILKINNENFIDTSSHWAHSEITYLAKQKIIKGDCNRYYPDSSITRAEFSSMILNCLGQESTEYSNAFNDVTKDDWYSNIVQTISELGIIIGENRQFYPNFGVTREEAATIIMRVYKYVTNIEYQANTNSDIFSDYYEFSEWAVNPIYSCYELNILRGETTNFFSPKRYLTKAEAAVIIVRLQNILY